MPALRRNVLLSGPLARLVDVCCRESSSACSGEERAGGHQLLVIRAGVFIKHSAARSGRSLVAEPMHALFLNRDEPFRISHPTTRGDDCTVLEFARDAVTEVVARLDPAVADRPDAPFAVTHAPFSEAARLGLHRLRTAMIRPGDSLGQEERMLTLLGQVLAAGYRAHGRSGTPRRASTRRDRLELVERTREALAVAPTVPWSLRDLAREVGSSPYHTTRVFRSVTGLPIHRHLVRLRLALALEDLTGGRRSLSAVGLRAGFASHSHFATAFRQAYGVPPGAVDGRSRASGGRSGEGRDDREDRANA